MIRFIKLTAIGLIPISAFILGAYTFAFLASLLGAPFTFQTGLMIIMLLLSSFVVGAWINA